MRDEKLQLLNSNVSVSVIIAARNEAQCIETCIRSILDNDYMPLEIIVVNDQSTDATATIIQEKFPDVALLHTSATTPGKKSAIKLAAHHAQGELLLFTDADCIVPQQWIVSMVQSYQATNAKFVAAPVMIHPGESVLSRFQFLDMIGTMAVTANGIHRQCYYAANGANMAVHRETFLDLYNVRKDEYLPSGDDMFVIQAISKRTPDHIVYRHDYEAIVHTKSEPTWKELWTQRVRWAGKSKAYSDQNIFKLQGFVFSHVIWIVMLIILIPFTGGLSMFIAIFMLFIKTCMDYLFLSQVAREYRHPEGLKLFIISAMIYNLYILAVGIVALIPRRYTWKGRTYQ